MTDQDPLEADIDSIGKNLNNNLSKLMEFNGISLSTIYRNTGIAIPTIKRLQSDPTTNPTITTLLPIAKFFGITITQLIGGEPLPSKAMGYIENKTYWIKVPFIKWNEIIDWMNPEKKTQINSYVLVDIDVGKNAFALRVEEDDWLTISKGSVLIINAELTPEHKDYVIVYKTGQSVPTLKQVLIDEEKIYLKPMNHYFQPTFFDKNYLFLGVLIQIRKDTKV